MIETPQEMRALSQQLSNATWTFAAVGALLESGLVEHLNEPRSAEDLEGRCRHLAKSRIERLLDVAAAAGVVLIEGDRYRLAPGAMPYAQAPMRTVLQGDIRTALMQVLALLDACGGLGPPVEGEGGPQASGWLHTSPALLQAQGDGSAFFPTLFKANVVPGLGDLATRLDRPGARFLDVGVGVASLSIAMCRLWPNLQAVGLDRFDVPLGLARQNVERAGLAGRIELRRAGVEDLRDEESFELAWLPSVFIASPVLPAAVACVRASLRPGGWMIFPVGGIEGDDARARAVFALICETWGGPALTVSEAQSLLNGVGFSTVRVLPGPPSTPPLLVAQR